MICKECAEQEHATCTNNQRPNSCDCQHRLTDDSVYDATLYETTNPASPSDRHWLTQPYVNNDSAPK